MQVLKRNGKLENVSFDKITMRIEKLCDGLDRNYIDSSEVAKKVIEGLYDGVSTTELDRLAAETAASMATKHPDFLKLASYIAVSNLHKNTTDSYFSTITKLYNHVSSETGEKAPLVSGELYNIVKNNKSKIQEQLNYDRDYLFDYFGFKTLERAYLMKCNGVVVERPQHLFMRVAIGIHGEDLEKAFETYHLMSQKYFIHATPTLFNAGSPRPQLSSCFLMTTEDSIDGIYKTLSDCAKISKYAGGIGFSIHDIRADGSYIKGTSGYSNGIVPMLKVFNETARYVDQSGKRKGSFACYLEPWHADIFEFLDLKKNHGKEELRARDLFYAMWIPDLFMQRVKNNEDWSLFCPNECKGLSDTYGKDFENLYLQYEKEGKAKKTIKAQALWFDILESQIETGTPYMLYKDACNEKSNQKNLGTIKSSNLCCIAGDQRVPTNKGMLTVKELYEEGTENLVVGREKIETASEMLLPRPNAEMGIIKTKQGYTHKVTPDHKVWVVDKGWVEAQDLKEGDKLQIQCIEGLFGDEDESDLAFICGLIAGDGTFSKSGAIIDTWDKNNFLIPEIENKIEKIIERYSDYLDDIYNPKFESATLYVSSTKPKFSYCKTNDNSDKYRLSSKHLMDILESKGFTKDSKTKVPEFVWLGNKKVVSEYLRGLFVTDGTVQGGHGVTTMSVSSTDKNFLEEVQILISNLGIKSSINIGKKREKSLLPDGKGGYKYYNVKRVYRLLITSIKYCKILEDITKIGKYRNNVQFLKNIENGKVYDVKNHADFESYERLPNEDAYCLMVDSEEHSWVVNGMVTKNTEIIEYTSKDETAVCNLASLSLPNYVENGKFNFDKLHEVTKVVTRNLNKVIDVNYYPTPETKNSNFKHRPIGIGVQGLADAFMLMKLPFDGEEARQLNKDIFETIYHASLESSMELSIEEGHYSSFEGSPTSKGILQFDMWGVKPSNRYNWDDLKNKIKSNGIRNSLLLAPMPTASTSQILGNNEAFEPYTSNLYSRRTLSGEFVIVNKHLIKDLIQLGLWNEDIREELIANNGSVQNIEGIPDDIKDLYKTVWEMSQKVIIDMSADRGAFICQSQSMNLFVESPNYSKLSSMHFYAWNKGLKTGMYYLRSKAAVDPIKFTLSSKYQNKFTKNEESSDDEDCLMCGA